MSSEASTSGTKPTPLVNSEDVPPSLAQLAPILRVANEIEEDNPRVANLCCNHVLKKAKKMDPNSTGVQEFKTNLTKELGRDRPNIDGDEISVYYKTFYREKIKDHGERREKPEEMAKNFQIATVLYKVLKEEEGDGQLDIETERYAKDVEERREHHNILPLYAAILEPPIWKRPEIKAAFRTLRHNVRNLRDLVLQERVESINDIFDWLSTIFGFQKGNVANQREHLILLLANMDIKNKSVEDYTDQPGLASETVEHLRDKIFENYSSWCEYLRRKSILRFLQGSKSDKQQLTLIYIGLYLLIWGEASNVRFMPECLCYIFHKMAYYVYWITRVKIRAEAREEEYFLKKVIAPIYQVLQKESTRNNEGKASHSTWRNYDDLNEYFWSDKCFKLGWPWKTDADFFSYSDRSPNQAGQRRNQAVAGRTKPKTNFVEVRTFWHLYRSFDRMWIFFILAFQAMVIFAWSPSPSLAAFIKKDGFKSVLNVLIASAILNLVQATLDIFLSWNAWKSLKYTQIRWYHLKFALAAMWAVVLPIGYSSSHDLVVQPKLFVGRRMHEDMFLKYRWFWIILLIIKLLFSYHVEISPLVGPTKSIMELFPNEYVGVVIAMWAPIVLVYFMDVQICYAIGSTIVGGYRGVRSHLGEIRTLEMLQSRFEAVRSAFSNRLIPPENKDTKGNNLIQTLGMLKSRFEAVLSAFSSRLIPQENKDAKRKDLKLSEVEMPLEPKNVNFSQVWNEFICSMRMKDLISDRGRDLLLFPDSSSDFSDVQWLPFLLASKIPIALDMAKYFKDEENYDELRKKIKSDKYVHSAVIECCKTLKDIISQLLGDKDDNLPQLCDKLEKFLKLLNPSEEEVPLERKNIAKFSQVWNEFIYSMRMEDLINDRGRDLLLFPGSSSDFSDVQWPSFLLASKIPTALDIAKYFKGNYDELREKIKSDDYTHSAVIECYETLKDIISQLLGDKDDNLPQLCDKLEKFLKLLNPSKEARLERKNIAIFSNVWNEFIYSMRMEDLISDSDRNLLLFPYLSSGFSVVQWPPFLLASKIPTALDMAKYFKDKENDDELLDMIESDKYMHSAVKECYETLKFIISQLLEDEDDRRILRDIRSKVDQSIKDKKFLHHFKISELPRLSEKLEKFLNLLLPQNENVENSKSQITNVLQDIMEIIIDGHEILRRDRSSLNVKKDKRFEKLKINQTREKFGREKVDRLLLLLTVKESAINVPRNLDARRRITFFANSLFMEMPRAPEVREMQSFSVLTPYYKEDVVYSEEEINKENDDGISILFYLRPIYPDEWKNLEERIKDISDPEKEEEIRQWVSYRGQTLSRTVRGMMYYREALKLQSFLEIANDDAIFCGYRNKKDLKVFQDEAQALADLKFTYVVSCQVYGNQKKSEDPRYKNIRSLMLKYPSLRVAYIDEKTENGEKVYFSVLVKGRNKKSDEEIYRIKLPGSPVEIGEGKPENQNHAIIFTRGEALQTIDMNQDNYFEEAFKMRNVLQEFKTKRPPTILGVREHIFTGSVSSLAWFMSNQETSFVTIGQRVLADPLRVRFHYGHPDIFDRIFHITRGGISKASKTINLSEDIFGGYNSTLRGGLITHHEYIQVGKGRDVGINQISSFEAKVASGNGEQTLSRDVYRLGHGFDFFRMLSFYFTTVGFYFISMVTVLAVYVFLYGRLYMVMSGLEKKILEILKNSSEDQRKALEKFVEKVLEKKIFETLKNSSKDQREALEKALEKVLEKALATQSLFQLGLLLVLPMVMEIGVEKGLCTALGDFITMQLELASVFFTFQLGTKAHYFGRTILHGGSKYRATGRGFVVFHAKFAENYRLYSRSHFVKGLELFILLITYEVYVYGGSYLSLDWFISFSMWFLVASWLFAPFVFNPSGFDWQKTVDDWTDWNTWMGNRGGIGIPADKSWESWWEEEQEHLENTNFLGGVLEIILACRFLIFHYGIVYYYSKSLLVYGLSWLLVVIPPLVLKMVSHGGSIFQHNRSPTALLFLGFIAALLFLGFIAARDVPFVLCDFIKSYLFAAISAIVPTVWALIMMVSDGGRNFQHNRSPMFRFIKALLFLGLIAALLFLGFIAAMAIPSVFCELTLTKSYLFAAILAFVPTGWALIMIGQTLRGCQGRLKRWLKWVGFFESIKELARAYDYIMGMLLFIPIAILSWFSFVSEFQSRLLFSQAFSTELQSSIILAVEGRKKKPL